MMGELKSREERTPLSGRLAYRYDECFGGSGVWRDISRVGAGIVLGRYLRPGRRIEITFEQGSEADLASEMPARVIWCRPAPQKYLFHAGLAIERCDAATALAYAKVRYAARDRDVELREPGMAPSVWFFPPAEFKSVYEPAGVLIPAQEA